MSDLDNFINGLLAQSKKPQTNRQKKLGKKGKIQSVEPPKSAMEKWLEAQEKRATTPAHRAPTQWQAVGYCMLINRATCRCGACHEAPQPRRYIKFIHPKYGVHIEAYDPAKHMEYRSLEPLKEFFDYHIEMCHHCFHFNEAQRDQHLQLDLEFPPTIQPNHDYEREIVKPHTKLRDL